MIYKIMIAKSRKDKPEIDKSETLYQFMTTTVDGVTSPLELEDRPALDARVEKMLNEEGFAKDDFIIVNVIDYEIDAKNYSDNN